MSYFLFIDESGHDRKLAPYEVLAGVCVEERELWNLIQRIWEAEERFFGMRVTNGRLELKGKKLLKRKTYRQAAWCAAQPHEKRRCLAMKCLEDGNEAGRAEIAALAQAKLAFVEHVLELCSSHRVRAFASVFDELEKAQSRILINQMAEYFRHTATGRRRASRIVPEPFFVHSDLTTAIQLADIVAYIVNWGVRFGTMNEPAREELSLLAEQVLDLRHKSHQHVNGNDHFLIWSFTQINDLRPMEQQ